MWNANFLYFSVLTWLTRYCSWWRSWCSYGWTAAGKRWRCLEDLIHFFAKERNSLSLLDSRVSSSQDSSALIYPTESLPRIISRQTLCIRFRELFWWTVREECHTTQQYSTIHLIKVLQPQHWTFCLLALAKSSLLALQVSFYFQREINNFLAMNHTLLLSLTRRVASRWRIIK